MPTPPDIVLLAPEWPTRALLRAQLIEEGYDVVATDVWPIPRQYLRTGMKPHMVIVDLHGLPDPRNVLSEMGALIKPEHVVVVTALGTLTSDEIRRLGFHVIVRPAGVDQIVAAAGNLLKASGQQHSADSSIADEPRRAR